MGEIRQGLDKIVWRGNKMRFVWNNPGIQVRVEMDRGRDEAKLSMC